MPTPFTQVRSAGGDALENTSNYPLGTRALQLPDSLVASQFLLAFGRPDRVQTCSCERQQDSSVTQALHLNNGSTLNDKLRAPNCRIQQWLDEKISDEEAIRRVFMLALARTPSTTELDKLRALMSDAAKDSGAEAAQPEQRRQLLEDLFWAVLTDREFLFTH